MSISTLADLMRAIVDAYSALGDTTTIQVGKRYVTQLAGPGRVVLVPQPGDWSTPSRVGAGFIAGVDFSVYVHIWGAEPETLTGDEVTDEIARFADADRLLDRFVNVLSLVAPGRIARDALEPVPDKSIMVHGESYVLRFAYARGVERERAVFRGPVTQNSARDPMRPNGDTGDTFEVDITTDAGR